MADAHYDMIAAGVPHRTLEASTDLIEIPGVNLTWGQTTRVGSKAIAELQKRFSFTTTADAGAAARLCVELSFQGLRVGVLSLGSNPIVLNIPEQASEDTVYCIDERQRLGSMEKACRILLKSSAGSVATAINYGSVDTSSSRLSAMLVRSSKILYLEDRLWDVDGGTEFVSLAIDAAKAAGRKIVLVCKDPDCISRNRVSIRNLTGDQIDYVVGEATTAALLYDLERTDSLVHKFSAISTGALLWRHALAPLILEGNIIGPGDTSEKIDSTTFWKKFLPARLSTLAQNGSILASPRA